jgi:hypothetical protein
MARKDITWKGQAIQAKPRQGNASKTRQGMERQGKEMEVKALKGKEREGKAWKD